MVATDVFGKKKKKSLKAKLGRKATQSANLTDTSFRSTKLHVSEQKVFDQSAESIQNAISFRKSWPEIAAQLSHPNSSVRLAALKSLAKIPRENTEFDNSKDGNNYDVVVDDDDDDVWKAIALTTTDEDASVRELGRLRLSERLSQLQQQRRHQDRKLKISGSLTEYLMAVTSTALNGLEDSLCMDGAKLVLLLAQHGIMIEDVAITKFLPALTRLLNDTVARRGGGIGEGSLPSKKRRKLRDASPKLLVLQAMHSMLETLTTQGNMYSTLNSDDHRLVKHQAVDSLVGQGDQSYSNIVSALQNQAASKFESHERNDNNIDLVLDLLSKLRQCLADDTLMVISAKIIRLILLHRKLNPSHNSKPGERLAKVAIKITQSLIEHFDEDRADDLCETLLSLSTITPDDSKAIAFVADHIQTSLENDIMTTHTTPSTSVTMLDILGKILWQQQAVSLSSSLERESIVSLIDLFVTVYFGENTNHASTCRTAAGRKAVSVGGYLLTSTVDYNRKTGALQDSEAKYGIAVRDILMGIPKYVEHWGCEYVQDTIRAIAVLRDVVRRSRKENDECGRSDQILLQRLRASVEDAWFGKDSRIVKNFERFPEVIQRHIVCLVAIIESPTEAMTRSFGTICGRLRISNLGSDGGSHITSYIVNCLYNIRRTLPMQQYIRFLMDSSGLFLLLEIGIDKGSEIKIMDIVKALDAGLLDASSYLVQCGTVKVLPMLEQLLIALLQKIVLNENDFASAVQARAAVAILAVLSMDAQKYGNNPLSIHSVFDILPRDFQKLTANSIRSLLFYKSDQVSNELFSKAHWIRPIVSLLSFEEHLFKLLIDSIAATFSHSDSMRQTQMLEIWLEIFENPKLSLLVKNNESLMIARVEAVERTSNDTQRTITQRIRLAIKSL